MVEVFKTNIESVEEARRIKEMLMDHLPHCRINIDLEDCDKVLRIEGNLSVDEVIAVIEHYNYQCEVLE